MSMLTKQLFVIYVCFFWHICYIYGRKIIMYLTRFTRTDGRIEDYLYPTEDEAKKHLLLFLNDDSGLYSNIAIIDNRNYVLHILPFQSGKPLEIISAGCCVKLKDEFARPEEIERSDIYVVTNINESTGRINITCLTSSMILKPTETVGIEMVRTAPIADKMTAKYAEVI